MLLIASTISDDIIDSETGEAAGAQKRNSRLKALEGIFMDDVVKQDTANKTQKSAADSASSLAQSKITNRAGIDEAGFESSASTVNTDGKRLPSADNADLISDIEELAASRLEKAGIVLPDSTDVPVSMRVASPKNGDITSSHGSLGPGGFKPISTKNAASVLNKGKNMSQSMSAFANNLRKDADYTNLKISNNSEASVKHRDVLNKITISTLFEPVVHCGYQAILPHEEERRNRKEEKRKEDEAKRREEERAERERLRAEERERKLKEREERMLARQSQMQGSSGGSSKVRQSTMPGMGGQNPRIGGSVRSSRMPVSSSSDGGSKFKPSVRGSSAAIKKQSMSPNSPGPLASMMAEGRHQMSPERSSRQARSKSPVEKSSKNRSDKSASPVSRVSVNLSLSPGGSENNKKSENNSPLLSPESVVSLKMKNRSTRGSAVPAGGVYRGSARPRGSASPGRLIAVKKDDEAVKNQPKRTDIAGDFLTYEEEDLNHIDKVDMQNALHTFEDENEEQKKTTIMGIPGSLTLRYVFVVQEAGKEILRVNMNDLHFRVVEKQSREFEADGVDVLNGNNLRKYNANSVNTNATLHNVELQKDEEERKNYPIQVSYNANNNQSDTKIFVAEIKSAAIKRRTNIESLYFTSAFMERLNMEGLLKQRKLTAFFHELQLLSLYLPCPQDEVLKYIEEPKPVRSLMWQIERPADGED